MVKFVTCAVDTGGNFAADAVDTGGKFAIASDWAFGIELLNL